MTFSNAVLLLAATFTALMAGLFYSYSFSVVPAMKALPDPQYIGAMQSINKAIQNPVFFLSFFGVLISLPLSAYLNYSPRASISFWLLLAASIIYFAGTFAVTIFGNIPLNNRLEKFDLAKATLETIALARLNFETKWNNLSLIRTVTSIAALVLVLLACLNVGKAVNDVNV